MGSVADSVGAKVVLFVGLAKLFERNLLLLKNFLVNDTKKRAKMHRSS